MERDSGVTSIVVNDLTYVGDVSIASVESLTSSSFPDTSNLSSIKISGTYQQSILLTFLLC